MVNVPQDKKLMTSIGDDAAAWYGDTSIQLATVDALVQDVHFSLNFTPWEDIGWKALAVNLSDIAGMGGAPRYALVSLALPDDTEVGCVTDLYKGMIELANQFGVDIVGGNVSRSSLAVVNVTVLGSAASILTRSMAKPGEQIAVTGYLGAAAGGLQISTGRFQFDSTAAASLKKALLRPYPRITEGKMLIDHGVRAAIDISDGLISDLGHVCQMSGVGALVEIDQIPIHPIIRNIFGSNALELALSGGEDYELLFTTSEEIVNKVKGAASCPITIIGEITIGDKIKLVDKQGTPFKPGKTGWEHFA
jgi:thiamine-monophosphate kinase